MQLKSLGHQSDLIFARFSGEVADCGYYLRIRTPSNPSYYWGNYLLFAEPPQADDFENWMALFANEIGQPPDIKHVTFAWDVGGQEAGLDPFLGAGFRVDRAVVMVTESVRKPVKYNADVEIRTLQSEEDFAHLLENKVLIGIEEGYDDTSHRPFQERKIASYRHMIAAGLGHWYGAFVAERLVANLGIFHEAGLGRYQSVDTLPEYRRRGIAATLVYEAGLQALSEYSLEQLVMIADQNYFAKDIYATVGFEVYENLVSLERRPQSH